MLTVLHFFYCGSIPSTAVLLTPGETRTLQLSYGIFSDILSTGSTLFAQVYATEWACLSAARPRGALLTIQNVIRVNNDVPPLSPTSEFPAAPVVTAEVRCTGRADIVGVADCADAGAISAWTVVRGVGRRVNDISAEKFAKRRSIALAEWATWKLCQELSTLQTRLGTFGGGDWGEAIDPLASRERALPIEQELRVWAPREYDREITEYEWAQTPLEVKNVWQARAEALSFAVLRRCRVDNECMKDAMRIVETTERLALGLKELERAKALALARLSINGALGDDDGTGSEQG